MDPKSRLKEFVKYKQISNNQFTQKVGLANGYLTGTGQVSSENLAKITEIYPELNLEWVITGKGYMIRPEKGKASYEYPVMREESTLDILKKHCEEHPELALIIDLIRDTIESKDNTIRSLIIASESKDKIIDNLQKENHDLRNLFEEDKQ